MPFAPLAEFRSLLSLPCLLVRFDLTLHTPADFDSLGIFFPPSLMQAVPNRRAEYLAGRWCAQQTMAQLGIRDVQTGTAENRAPLWPSGVVGTITHSHHLALAMVARADTCRGIGADIEFYMSQQQELELQSTVLHPFEQPQFTLLSRQLRCPLTLLFSAKESIFKALYPSVNQYFGFEAAALTGFNESYLWFSITTALSAAVPAGSKVTVRYQLFDAWLCTECQF
ncbi:4'-phosphopantetheinyl transferase superfamily protein [Rheinheimera riviphila]|uniref:Enterobactin synthase component D n=1 Tax=Rheinheimera riviphila TaxID=1834037 RepID=A0A437QJ31_9GAMM|nr:4'-phosphopantetheinyl transferase superfamily protein [Rheinheimera riviphila]RVU34503.1 4'-phosphopantetheinyl transferase superfamily protein [Rheinheimera riviphila]